MKNRGLHEEKHGAGEGRRRTLRDGSYEPRHTPKPVAQWWWLREGAARMEAEDENGKVT